MKKSRVVVSLIVVLLVSGLVPLLASDARGFSPTPVQKANIQAVCDPDVSQTQAYVANYGSSASPNYNAPADDAHPQFYAGIEAHTNTGCTVYITSLKVTVTGTDPNGVALTGDRFNALTALPSPDSSGSSDVSGVLTFIKVAIQIMDPTGASNALDLMDQNAPQPTNYNGASAWAQWQTGMFLVDRDKGLRFGFQLVVDTNAKGSYLLHLNYEVTFQQNFACTDVGCAVNTWDKTLGEDVVYCYLACTPGQTDNSAISAASIPAAVNPGANFQVSITMRNTGTAMWFPWDRGASYNPEICSDCRAVYRLGTQTSTWTTTRADLPTGTVVLPGGSYTFTFTVTAPTTPGSYSFSWQMVREGPVGTVWEWFGSTTSQVVKVGYKIGPIHSMGYASVQLLNPSGATIYTATADSSGNVPGMAGLAPGQYQATGFLRSCGRVLKGFYSGAVYVTIGPDQAPTIPMTFHSGGCPIDPS